MPLRWQWGLTLRVRYLLLVDLRAHRNLQRTTGLAAGHSRQDLRTLKVAAGCLVAVDLAVGEDCKQPRQSVRGSRRHC